MFYSIVPTHALETETAKWNSAKSSLFIYTCDCPTVTCLMSSVETEFQPGSGNEADPVTFSLKGATNITNGARF